MPQYNNEYIYDVQKEKKLSKKTRKIILKDLNLMLESANFAKEPLFFKQKIREAMFWMENNLG